MRKEKRDFEAADKEKEKVEKAQREKAKAGVAVQPRYALRGSKIGTGKTDSGITLPSLNKVSLE